MKEKFEKWMAEFLRSPTESMSTELTQIFLSCTMSEASQGPIPDEIRGEFLFKVIDKRAEHIGLTMTDWSKVFLMFLAKSPGSAVMYLCALRSIATELSMDLITVTFPMGFLSEDQMSKMYDAQKGSALGIEGVDNTMDHYKFEN